MRLRFPVMVLAVVLLCCVSAVVAQVLTGSLTGQVLDPQSLAIPNAKVTIVDIDTGRTFNATTGEDGTFTVTNLQKGFYKVTVEAHGFAKFTVAKVQLNVGEIAKVYAKMELAAAGTQVVVTSEQAVVETESAELKNSVDRVQILNLPLPTRNPLDLARTMAGIVTPTASGIADAFVHGLRGNSTNITQDGINVADNFVKTSSFFAISAPTVDTVGEFSISTGGVGADAGFGAANVTIVTQRGSNAFHGSVFWFQRTSAFNSNVWFNNATSPQVPRPFHLQNRIGVSAGGPVFLPKLYDGRNRTWLFGNYEAFREPVSRSRTRTVLTPSARTGMFTYTDTGGTQRTVDLTTLGSTPRPVNTGLMNFYNSLVPTDPLTDAGCASGDTVNIRCFRFNLPGSGVQDRYTLRADHQLTKNHAVEFVFNQSDFDSTPDFLNGIEPQFPKSTGGGQRSRRQTLSWGFHSTFGGNKTNEVRVGYQRAPVEFALDEKYTATNGFQLASPSLGIPAVTLTSPTITSTNLPQGRNTPVRQIKDNFAWVKGRHTLRFGGEYRQILANSFFFNVVVPRVVLGNNSVNTPLSGTDFPFPISSGDLNRANVVHTQITGLISSVSQGFNHTSPTSGFVAGVPRTIDPIQHNLSGYFQDSFKFRPNLTFTAGLRYEFHGVFDLRNKLVLLPQDGLSGLWGPSGINNLFSPRSTPVLNDTLLGFAGGNNGKPIYGRDINNFAPFFGFAWDPWKSGKTSIRGAAAVHYTQDGFTLFQLASTGNTGLFLVASSCDTSRPNCTLAGVPTGVFNPSSVPTPAAPTATFPASQRANFVATNGGANLWVFHPNLRTPYVVEWNLSVSRELWRRVTVEGRYVGNRGISLHRSSSINELNLLNSPFTFGGNSVANMLTEFRNAQTNLNIFIAANPNCGQLAQPPCRFDDTMLPGQMPLPILQALFTGLAPGQAFSSGGFITQLQQNQIGGMFNTLRTQNTYRANRESTGPMGSNFPLNFFVANPFANNAILVDNSSSSTYHGFEFEVRRRFSTGLFFQANYTFSKVLTDAIFLTDQQENQNYRSLLNRRLDRNRAAFDVPHSFSASFIYPLPFGKGKWLGGNANPVLDKFIGGWQFQGLTRISTGSPFTITSGRLTTGSLRSTTAVLRNMTPKQLQNFIGVHQTAGGVFWLDPKSGLIAPTGRAVMCSPGQTTPCFAHPGVNEEGNTPFLGLNAPKFVNQDFGITKRTSIPSISEAFNVEVKFEFFNAFNHPNFGGLTTGIDAATFGQLTSIVDTVRGGGVTSRIIQWALRVNW